jgi:hypothetical protein
MHVPHPDDALMMSHQRIDQLQREARHTELVRLLQRQSIRNKPHGWFISFLHRIVKLRRLQCSNESALDSQGFQQRTDESAGLCPSAMGF